jgi:hypothetical protein
MSGVGPEHDGRHIEPKVYGLSRVGRATRADDQLTCSIHESFDGWAPRPREDVIDVDAGVND